MAGEEILIVDDNAANLRLIAFVLENRGFRVRTASDATGAMAAIGESLPRLILMDVQLPGMDGLTLTRRLKADAATRGIIIVAVTAYAMKGDEDKATAAGCDGYITKPIDTRALGDQVAALLSRPPPPPNGEAET